MTTFETPDRAPLFVAQTFTSHSGATLHWKIECDGLTHEDWAGAARIAVDFLPPFGDVYGVPRGGLPFAAALRPYMSDGPLLIVDDVCTTGNSLNGARAGHMGMMSVWTPDPIGVVLFARGPCPSWVTPLFSLPVRPDRTPAEPPNCSCRGMDLSMGIIHTKGECERAGQGRSSEGAE